MTRTPIANQGEIRIDRIDALPECATKGFDGAKLPSGIVVSHSESGNHHVLGGDAEVLERVDVPRGMRILHAIVRQPARLFQDAAVPHEAIDLDPGIYELRLKREFNPFADEARQVAD